jgi:hypothetical protein
MRTSERSTISGSVFLFAGPPTSHNDATHGFRPGIQWIDTSTTPHTWYVCADAAIGAAIWTSGGGGATTGPLGAVALIEMFGDPSSGQTVTIFDGTTTYIFEFRVSGAPAPGHIPVAVVTGSSATNLATAIAGSGARVTALAGETFGTSYYVVYITSNLVGPAGNSCTVAGTISASIQQFAGGTLGYSLVDAQRFAVRPHGAGFALGATWEVQFHDSSDAVGMRLGWAGTNFDTAGFGSDSMFQAVLYDNPFVSFAPNARWSWVWDQMYGPQLYYSVYWGPTSKFYCNFVFNQYNGNLNPDGVSDIVAHRLASDQFHSGAQFKVGSGTLGNTTTWLRYQYPLATLQALGATTTGSTAICPTLTGGHIVERIILRVVTTLTGPGLSAASATAGTAGGLPSNLLGASSLTGAPETTYKATPAFVDFVNDLFPTLNLSLTGCNFSALTAGSVEVYVEVANLLDG